jgi:hypothetical protein
MEQHKSKQCPECGSISIMPIVYGLTDNPEAKSGQQLGTNLNL